MKKEEIEEIVRARFEDADALFRASRYDGSVYLCGYAIELGLKARICKALQWKDYPTTDRYRTFKTHSLDILLHLSGFEGEIKLNCLAEWSIVAEWTPETRYSPIGSVRSSVAENMLESTRALLKIL